MIQEFKIGQTVHVWPRPGLRVLVDPQISDRFLTSAGADVAWSPWWQRRAGDGSVLLTDPSPAPAAPAVPESPPEKPDPIK